MEISEPSQISYDRKNISNYLITTIKRVTIFVVTLHFVFLIFANDALWSQMFRRL